MSRTSRRASRQLFVVVTVAIVLGVFFTVHKLKSSGAIGEQASGGRQYSCGAGGGPEVTPPGPSLRKSKVQRRYPRRQSRSNLSQPIRSRLRPKVS